MITPWLRRKTPARARRVGLHAEWLEPRLLYSADAGALIAATTDDTESPESRTLSGSLEYAAATAEATPTTAEILAAYALTPLQFEVNAGQLEEGADFAAFGSGYGIQLDGGRAQILLAGADAPVTLELVGARTAQGEGENLLATRSNYLVGADQEAWVTDIANYGSVRYDDVYEGIDVRYYGNQGLLEYDFIVAAGADASQLQLRFDGVDAIRVDANGDLVMRVAGAEREIRFQAPVSYQQGPGGREAVDSHYALQADGTVRIVVGDYDTTRELVVDPVLAYATYFGDSQNDVPTAVALGADGSVYITGYTNGIAGELAPRIGASTGGVDLFVARFSADLGTLLYSTRIGGSGDDRGHAIAVDAAGNAVVVGTVSSSNFPTAAVSGTTVDQAAQDGTKDSIVLKLNAAGNGLVFSTYFGGSGNTDAGAGVALDASGNIYVAGTIAVGTNEDAYVNIYNADGVRQASRQFGGSGSDGATDVAVDAAGNVYVVGSVVSAVPMVNGHLTTRGGGPDGFLVRYDAGGTITYSTYIGGSNGDIATGVAVDSGGRAYVIGRTDNPAGTSFATTSGALSTAAESHNTGYLRIYDTNTSGAGSLTYSTFIGGSGSLDSPTGIALIGGSRAVMVGTTDSTDMPTTTDAVRRTNSATSAFAMVVDPGLTGSSQLVYGTYFATDASMGGVAVSGNTFYLAGATTEAGLATTGSYQPTIGANDEGFVAAIGGFNFNIAPTLVSANDLPAIIEDSAAGSGALVSSLASITDPNTGALAGIAIVAADSSNGTWQYTLNGTTWVTFTAPAAGTALLLPGDATARVRFVPAANFAGESSITFHAWDRTTGAAGAVVAVPATGDATAFSSTTASSRITVTGVNDAPVLAGTPTTSLTFTESATPVSLAAAGFDFAPGGGSDEAGQSITIVVTRLPTNAGTLQLADGTPVVLGGTYTLAELQNMRIQLRAPGDAFMFDVRDSGGTAGGGQDTLSSQFVSISVTNVAPVLGTPNPLTQLEDLPGNGTLVSDLLAGAVSDPGGAYGIAVTAVPSSGAIGGSWQYSLDGGTTWLALSGSNNNSRLLGPTARVRFVGDAGMNVNGTIQGFTFRAWDGSSGTAGGTASTNTNGGTSAFSTAAATVSLYVTPVNDIPVRYDTVGNAAFLPAPANVAVNEYSAQTSLGLSYLDYIPGYSQEEYDNQTLAYTVTAVPGAAVGTVYLGDGTTVVTAGSSYTLAQLRNMRFLATPGAQNVSGTFSWSVQDTGGTANGGVDTLLESITISVRNVAPTLSGTNNLLPILEDTPGTGTKVSDLVGGRAFDPSNTVGIAVTGVNTASGTWEYTRDNGSTWTSLSGASATSAVLLAPNGQTRVRFVPNANFNGTVSGLSFRAWDLSAGVAGGTADTTANGGTTAFSTTTATAAITVGGVNDSPLRTAGTLAPLILLDGSPATSLGLGGLAYAPGGAADEAGQSLTYTVTSVPSSLGTVLLANGSTVVTAGSTYTLAQIQGMQFRSSGIGALGTSALTFSVKDSGGTANGGVDTLVQSVPVIVNRAPVLNGSNAPLTVFEDFTATNNAPGGQVPPWANPAQRAGVAIGDFVSGQIVDSAGSLSGIAVNAVAGNGTWQYTIDGGSNWQDITAVSDSGALLLAVNADTKLRFLPGTDFNSAIGTASISFRAWDQTTGSNGGTADTSWNGGASAYSVSTATAVATITAVNDAPVRTAGALATVSAVEGGPSVSLGLADIAYAGGPATASDEAAQTLTYRVTGLPSTLGTIYLADGTTVVTSGTVYTLAQIQGMRFQATPGVLPGTGSFSFEVQDNGGVANGGSDKLAQVLAITVTNVAPVLHGANAMHAMVEDTPDGGTLVSDLVAGQVTDVTTARGIAVTGADSTHGSWQYTTDGGTTWQALGSPTDGSARLLAADALTRVRFVPAAHWNGTASLTFAAWDRSIGVAGGTADARVGGGTAPFSTATATTSVVVSAVNDAPVLTGGVVAGLSVAEDSGSTSLGLAGVAYGPGGGVDEAAQALVYTVTALPPASLGTVTLGDGTAVTTGSYTLAQLQGMRFVAAAHATGSGSFSFKVQDNGGGLDTLVQTIAITVTPVNDVPVRTAGSVAALAVAEDSGTTALGLGTVAYAPGGGSDEAGQGLSYTVTTLPPATLGRIVLADGSAVAVGSYTLEQLRGMRFEAAADASGTASFGFSVVDDGGGSDTLGESLAITVTPVNDTPVRTGGLVADLTVAEDSGATALGLGSLAYGPGGAADEAAQVLTFTVTALPPASLGRIVLADGTTVTAGDYSLADLQGMQFVAAPNAYGTGAFGWSVVDDAGGAGTLPQTLQITVTPVDDPTVAVADTASAAEDGSASGNVLANDIDVDSSFAVATFQVAGEPATYTAGATATIAGQGTLTIAADGSFTFTPVADWNGSVPVVSYATDTGAIATLSITVTAVDDPSAVVADGVTVVEDSAATGNVLTNDSDVDSALAVASFQVAGDATIHAAGATATVAGSGTLILGADGSFTFTPVANWHGTVPVVSYTTTTGATATLTVTLTPVDDATTAAADSLTVAEDSAASGNVLANDSDADTPLAVASFQVAGDAGTYAAGAVAAIAGQGTISIAADGSFTFTPVANWNGSVPVVSYTTTSGAVATLAITVTPADDPAVAAADTVSVPENTSAIGNVLGNDVDVDSPLAVANFQVAGDGTTYAAGSSVSIAGVGVLTLGADGSYSFVPVADWNGTVPVVSYTTGSGAGSTLTVTVTPVDTVTSANADTATAAEDSGASGNVLSNDSDADDVLAVASFQVAGDATVYAAGATVTLAGQGSLTLAADGSYSFTPVAHWNGVVPVLTYTTNTGASSTLAITVTPIDDATQAQADAQAVAEDGTATGNVLANDTDVDSTLAVSSFQVAGNAFTFGAGSSVAIAGKGTVSIAADGSYSFTPVANWNGSVPVVSYTTNTGVTGTLAITVAAVDDPASAVADTVTVAEDSAAAGNVLANDSDVDSPLSVASFQVAGDAATYTAGATATISGQGTITIAADGSFTFTPVAHWNGTVPVVSYTTGTGATGTLAITLAAVDDPTWATADTGAAAEDSSATGNVLANDTDVDSTLAVASFQVAGDTAVYTAGATATIAGKGTITLGADGSFTFTPAADWNGSVPVVSYTTDTGATGTLAITIAAVDDASQVAADSVTVAEDNPASGNVLGNDGDVDSTLAVASFQVAGDATVHAAGSTATVAGAGTITIAADGSFTFTPVANWNGTVPLVSYTTSTAVTGTLGITVSAVDDPTVAAADSAGAAEDRAASGNVLANDSDVDDAFAVASFQVAGDTAVYMAGATATIAGKGTITLGADGSFTFTPAADWNGSVPVVSYTTDTGATGTLAITIAAVDDASQVAADSVTVAEDNPASGNVLGNDSDIDSALLVDHFQLAGDTNVYAAGVTATIAGVGSIRLDADGSYTFTPVANWNGSVPLVSYTTNTGATGALAVAVTPVDDPSVAAADSVTVAEDNGASGNVLANDSDVDNVLAVASFQVAGDPGTYAAGSTVTLAGIGTITVGADGAFAFTPAADWNGSVPVVNYTLVTGTAGTLAITVTAEDDATVAATDAAAIAEDTPASGNVLANDTDVDSALAVVSFQVTGDGTVHAAGTTVTIAGTGTVRLDADGSYTFTPEADWNGVVPVLSYTTNTSVTSTLAITVTPADDPTVATADAVTVAEDSTATGNVLANDTDVDSTVSVASFQVAGDGSTHAAGATATIAGVGTITIGADGSYTFTPAAHWNGSVPVVSYTTDTGVTSTLAIVLAPVADPTAVAADSITADEDTLATGNVLANDSDPDAPLAVASFTIAGDATVYAAGGTAILAGVGSFSLAADGSFTFTPAADWNGSVPLVSYTTDTGPGSTLAITIAAVAEPTVTVADTVTVTEESTATGNVLANDTDADGPFAVASFRVAGDATTYAAGSTATIAGAGTVTIAADGSYTFTPLANWNGNVPVVSYTTDTGATSTLTVSVTPVDDLTQVAADSNSVAEDNAAAGNVLANDSDADGPLQVASFTVGGTSYAAGTTVAVAGAGSFTLAADGSYSFTPLANWNGAVPQVTYATDTGSTGMLDIAITAVNDPSVVAADAVNVAEDSTATGNVLGNDTDVDDTLAIATFQVAGDGTVHSAGDTVAVAGAGTITLNADGSYSFTPVANWNGTVPQVSYTTNSGVTASLNITVTPVDDASVAGADSMAVAEDNPASGNVLANDSDVDNVLAVASFEVAGDSTLHSAGASVAVAGAGTFTLNADGSYSFTPTANWNGSVPVVSYTTNTGVTGTLALTVSPVNDPTVIAADSASAAEDTPAGGNVLGNDSDADDPLAVASFQVAGDGTLHAGGDTVVIAGTGTITLNADGSYTFTPVANWNGTVPVVSYTTNTGATGTLAITVTPVDDASVAGADSATVAEDNTATGNVLANDSDIDSALAVTAFQVAGDTASYAVGDTVAIAGVGTLTLNADGSYTFTPLANWNGTVPVVSYTTSTGVTGTLAVTVTAADDPTVAVADGNGTAEDTPASGNVLANDTDVDDALAVTGFQVAGDGTVYAAGDTVTIAGIGTIRLAADGSYSFTPAANWNGTVPVISYTTNTGAVSTLAITVSAVDDPSMAAGDSTSVAEDSTATGNVLANDGDADTALAVASFVVAGDATVHAAGSVVTLAGQGTISIAADGSFAFTPAANWNGAVPQVSYTTNSGVTASLNITVTPVDDASVAGADSMTVAEDNTASGNVLGNDSDVDSALAVASFRVAGDPGTYLAGAAAAIAGMGTITLGADGAYAFTPAADWNGSVPVITYTTSSGATATLAITVDPADDATTARPDSIAVAEDGAAGGNVLANDADIDDALAITGFQIAGDSTVHAAGTSVAIAGQGTLTLGADGSFTFSPLANWNGTLPVVSYTTNTGASSTLAITVTPVDDASLAAADGMAVAEDSPAAGNVLANDSDVDSTLQVASFSMGGTSHAAGTAVTIAGAGSFTLAANGTYTFTPAANWNGSVPQVTYATTTGATSTLDIVVAAVDDATVVAPDALTVNEDTPVTGNVLANDSDVDNTLQVASFSMGGILHAAGSAVNIAGLGSFTLAANGSYTFTPGADWSDSVLPVAYTTNTGAAGMLQITVAAVDDATLAAADALVVAEDTPAAGNVLANDSDVDSSLRVAGFSIAGASSAAGGTVHLAGIGSFTLAANGDYTFTPVLNWNGSVPQVIYTTDTGASSTLDLSVSAVDDAAAVVADAMTVAEDTPAAGNVLANDRDVDSPLQVSAFTIAGTSYAAGTTVAIAGIGSFTLAANGDYSFTPAADWNGSVPQVGYVLATGAAGTLDLGVSPVNDAPVRVSAPPAGFTVVEGGAASSLGLSGLSYGAGGGSDEAAQQLAYSVTGVPAGLGKVVLADGTEVLAGAGYTLAELRGMRFVPAGGVSSGSGVFAFTVGDGSGAVLDERITVSVVNQAPVLSGANALPPMREDSMDSAGMLVGDLIAGQASDPLGRYGIAVVSAASSGGRWEFTRDGGATWHDFTGVAESQAELLAADAATRVRFVPHADWNGVAGGLAFRAWDLSAGSAGTRADTTVHGGSSAFSSGIAATSITVAAVDEADAGEPALVAVPAPAPDVVQPALALVPPPAPLVTAAAAPALPGAGRVQADPLAPAGDALVQSPVFSALLSTASGFDAQYFKLVRDAGQGAGLALVAHQDPRTGGFGVDGTGDFLVTGFNALQGGATRITVEQFQQALRSGAFIDELNRLRRELSDEFDLDRSATIAVAGLSLGASVAYVLWLVRGGVLLGSYLSALPAWRLLDPLPVLARHNEEEDDEDEAFDPVDDKGPDPLRGFA